MVLMRALIIGGILGSVVFRVELVSGVLIGTYIGARIDGQTEPCTRVAMALVGALVDGILGSVVPGVELVLGALIGIYAEVRIVALLTEEAGMWAIIVLMLLLVLALCLVASLLYILLRN